jgi:hypothetical protein
MQHAAAQTEILRQLHDELDGAVLAAYGRQDLLSVIAVHRCPSLAQSVFSAETSQAVDQKNQALSSSTNAEKEKGKSASDKQRWTAMKKEDIDAEILTRLVALNRERAEEEKRGLIRWLRPEYQAPETVQPLAKPLLEVEPEAVEPTPTPAIEIQPGLPPDRTRRSVASSRSREALADGAPWPKDLKEQLADLGVITRLETAKGSRYHRPQAVGA